MQSDCSSTGHFLNPSPPACFFAGVQMMFTVVTTIHWCFVLFCFFEKKWVLQSSFVTFDKSIHKTFVQVEETHGRMCFLLEVHILILIKISLV